MSDNISHSYNQTGVKLKLVNEVYCLNFNSQRSVRVMAALVKEGKARHIGLSEASASTIRKANAVSPIYCIEQV